MVNPDIALLTDTHIGCKNDSSVVLDYQVEFFQNIFFPYLKKNNIKTVFHLGDVVDRRKYINFKTLNIFRKKVLHPLEEAGIQMYVIPGNHDCYHKNSNEVNALQELLGGWSNIKIYHEPDTITIGNNKFLMMPWINSENYERFSDTISSTDANIIIGHLEINGFTMHHGSVCENGFERSTFNKFDAVFSGHFHFKSTEGNISYLGSPYEMTFGDLGISKGFHVFEADNQKLRFIENPLKMFHRIYYDDKFKTLDKVLSILNPVSQYKNSYVKVVVLTKLNPYYFDKFMDTLYQVGPADVKIIEDTSYTDSAEELSLDLAEDTLSISLKYVDSLEISDNKEKLKDIIRVCYNEASDIEGLYAG